VYSSATSSTGSLTKYYHEYSYIKTDRVQHHLSIWNGGCIIFRNYNVIDGVYNVSNNNGTRKLGRICATFGDIAL